MSETRASRSPLHRAPRPALSLDDLPPVDTKRWVSRRKAEVVTAVQAGLLSVEQACARYSLSAEELSSWQQLVSRHGPSGLRATRLQDYRRTANYYPVRDGCPGDD